MSDDELISENSPIEQYYEIFKLLYISSQYECSSSNYSDYNNFDFENDTDPANNIKMITLIQNLMIKCVSLMAYHSFTLMPEN